jgi:hypothetical protein
VAGSFLYSGIQNLMGNHNPGGAFGSANGHNNQQPASYTENTTVNNYYANDPVPKSAYDSPELSGGYDVADASDDFGGSDDTA